MAPWKWPDSDLAPKKNPILFQASWISGVNSLLNFVPQRNFSSTANGKTTKKVHFCWFYGVILYGWTIPWDEHHHFAAPFGSEYLDGFLYLMSRAVPTVPKWHQNDEWGVKKNRKKSIWTIKKIPLEVIALHFFLSPVGLRTTIILVVVYHHPRGTTIFLMVVDFQGIGFHQRLFFW